MYVVLTIAFVIFMLALPPLVPAWTGAATLTVVTLEILCLALIIAIWWRRMAIPALRIAAAIVFGIFLLAAIDQLRAAIASGTPVIGGRTPIVGLFVVGIPCAIFAIRGVPRGSPDDGDPIDGEDDFDDEFDDGLAEDGDLKARDRDPSGAR